MEDLLERFYVGDYKNIASAAGAIKQQTPDVEFIILRARIYAGQIDFVIMNTNGKDSPHLQAVNLIARAKKSGDPSEIGKLINTIDDDFSYKSFAHALLLMDIGEMVEAIDLLSSVNHPEAAAYKTKALLAINRSDVAESVVATIENPTLRSFWTAITILYSEEGDKKSALYTLLDLVEYFGKTSLLAGAISAAYFSLGQWEEGNQFIENAQINYPDDDVILVNSIIGLQRSRDPSQVPVQTQLLLTKQGFYTHRIQQMLADFDETVSRLQENAVIN